MNVVISFHDGDRNLAISWANHVAKLGPYINHKIIVVGAPRANPEGIVDPLKRVFGTTVYIERNRVHREGWPGSCNESFQSAFWFNQLGGIDLITGKPVKAWKEPFLWMEPDAVPLDTNWIDLVEKEYRMCGRPFMGDIVAIQGIVPNGEDHMSGIAVYPSELHTLAPRVLQTNVIDRETGRPRDYAWDICGAEQIVPQMARTNLIHHDWVNEKEWRRQVVTKDCVRKGAVIYHPDKNHVLINSDALGSGVQGDSATGNVGLMNHSGASPSSELKDMREMMEALKRQNEELISKIKGDIKPQPIVKRRGRRKKVS